MPVLHARIRAFCAAYHADTPPEALIQALTEHFAVGDDRATVRAVVILRGDEVVAHCIVSLDPWCQKLYATILQFETDVAIPRAVLRDGWEQILWWAKGKGATTARMLVRTGPRFPARVRLYRALYGARVTSVTMDVEIA
jgi:hypothetical protein